MTDILYVSVELLNISYEMHVVIVCLNKTYLIKDLSSGKTFVNVFIGLVCFYNISNKFILITIKTNRIL